jgi:glutamate dehydrogenase
VAGVYFSLSARLGLGWLRDRIAELPGEGHWQTLAKTSMRDDLADLQRTLTGNILADDAAIAGEADANLLVGRWEERHLDGMERAARLLADLRAAPTTDLAMLSVGLRELRNLA